MKFERFANVAFYMSFNKLAAASLPPKLAYKVKKLAETLSEESKKYEDLRKDLLNKHASKDDAGELKLDDRKMVEIPTENTENFGKDMIDLMSVEFDLPCKIKLSEFEKNDKTYVELSAQDLDWLSDMLDFND